ncbi:MAG UNVERIFIED_CONTAM: hypothetical protein LVR18_42115 [Planctomycetaceae bacterium]|jgi:hypothetical protein
MIAPNRPLFSLGQTVATPGAVEWLQQADVDAALLLSRHENGDWGDLDEEDSAANQAAVTHGDRILSCYNIRGNSRVRSSPRPTAVPPAFCWPVNTDSRPASRLPVRPANRYPKNLSSARSMW